MSTAKNNPAEEGKGLPEWQKERIAMARDVFESILNPLMLFSEVLTAYDQSEGVELDLADIGAAVRLFALGGMVDMMMGGTVRHIQADGLYSVLKDWMEAGGDA